MALGVIRDRCAGLDVHKKTVVAAVNVLGQEETRTFGTATAELLDMVGWLRDLGVRQVAMESTGPYWKPVYNLLEAAEIEATVGNAAHIKGLPGRKTDVNDAQWICDLHRHGLIKPSFIPARPQRELRELIRYRIDLIAQRAAEANRIAKVLEGGNIKLGSVATDILGKSGRAMLESIAGGESDPNKLADLALGRLRSKHDELVAALQGKVNAHQRQMLRYQLEHVAFLDAQIVKLDAEVAMRLDPFDKEIDLLDTIPGVNRRVAEVILAECGVDMSRFPNADHLVSWAGLSPDHYPVLLRGAKGLVRGPAAAGDLSSLKAVLRLWDRAAAAGSEQVAMAVGGRGCRIVAAGTARGGPMPARPFTDDDLPVA